MSGAPMKYPYSTAAKFMQFPWRWYWKNSRFIRFYAYACAVSFPLFVSINKKVNSPENVAHWKNISAHRMHDKFAPLTEGGHGH